jgi:hypothetical protein
LREISFGVLPQISMVLLASPTVQWKSKKLKWKNEKLLHEKKVRARHGPNGSHQSEETPAMLYQPLFQHSQASPRKSKIDHPKQWENMRKVKIIGSAKAVLRWLIRSISEG